MPGRGTKMLYLNVHKRAGFSGSESAIYSVDGVAIPAILNAPIELVRDIRNNNDPDNQSKPLWWPSSGIIVRNLWGMAMMSGTLHMNTLTLDTPVYVTRLCLEILRMSRRTVFICKFMLMKRCRGLWATTLMPMVMVILLASMIQPRISRIGIMEF